MKKAAWAVAALILVLILVRIGVGLSRRTSDADQIRKALAESIQAGKEGRPGGVLQLIGEQISYNSQDASGQLGQVAQFIKQQRPDVHVEDQTPLITGDNAEISSPVTMDLSFLSQHRTIHLKHVILIFHKESGTSWGILPVKKWKLEQVQVPDFSPEQLLE